MTPELLRATAAAVADEFARCREKMSRVTLRVTGVTEKEVLAAATQIAQISREAADHVQELGSTAEAFSKSTQVIQSLSQTQAEILAKSTENLRDQEAMVTQSMDIARRISEYGGQVREISLDARMLTINARIESARLGATGGAFAVIADQMASFSRAVEAANTTIAELAEELSRIMPRALEAASALRAHTEEVAIQKSLEMQMALQEADASMTHLLHSSKKRAESIRHGSHQVLSHLQFQDIVAQELRDVESLSRTSENVLQKFFDDVARGADPQLAIGAARADADQVNTRLGQSLADEDKPDAGELILF